MEPEDNTQPTPPVTAATQPTPTPDLEPVSINLTGPEFDIQDEQSEVHTAAMNDLFGELGLSAEEMGLSPAEAAQWNGQPTPEPVESPEGSGAPGTETPPDPTGTGEPTPEAEKPWYAEFTDGIKEGNWNEFLSRAAEEFGVDQPPKLGSTREEEILNFLQAEHPGVVMNDWGQAQNHLGTVFSEHASQSQILQGYNQLLERAPRLAKALEQVAHALQDGREISEDQVAFDVFGSAIKLPELSEDILESEPELKSALSELKAVRDRYGQLNQTLEARTRSQTEAETRLQAQTSYLEGTVLKALDDFKEAAGLDDQAAMKRLEFAKTLLFGDKYGNRPPATALLEAADLYMRRDQMISKAEHERLLTEARESAKAEALLKADGKPTAKDLARQPELAGGTNTRLQPEEELDPFLASVLKSQHQDQMQFDFA